MKVRGQRECTDCGARWSYYDTGSVECPDCGSLRSVGVEEDRKLHTDAPAEFDLTEAREILDSRSGPDSIDPRAIREAAERAGELAREYVRKRGFVRGGDLRPLGETDLAARELRHAADVVSRGLDLTDDEEWYFLALLRNADAGAEGEGEDDADSDLRPAADEVPESMHPIRGLAAADAADEYRREMADWADENEASDAANNAIETLGDHVRRVQALDGDVTPETAEELVAAARDVGRYLRSEAQRASNASSAERSSADSRAAEPRDDGDEPRAGDDELLASARERFDRLAE